MRMTATASGSAASETAHFSPKQDAGGKPWRRHFVMTVKPVRMCLGWLDWLGCSAQPNGCSGTAERATASQQRRTSQPVVVTSSYIHSQHPSSQLPANDPNKVISYCKMFIASEGAGGASKGTASWLLELAKALLLVSLGWGRKALYTSRYVVAF